MLRKRGLETIWMILLVVLMLIVLGVVWKVLSSVITKGIGQ